MKKKVNYLLIFLSLALDLISISLFNNQFIYLINICFIINLLNEKKSLLIITLFFLSLESLLIYDIFGLDLLYLIPIAFIFFKFKKILFYKRTFGVILFLIIMLLKFFLVEGFLYNWNINYLYTFYKIFVNLLLVIIILKFKGRSSNRI